MPSAGAVPSVEAVAPVDVVPPDARRELDRVRTRWAQLPLVRAEEALPAVRALLDDLARRSAGEAAVVPDLGPGAVVDQLAVLVWDACAEGRGDDLAGPLAALRRTLP